MRGETVAPVAGPWPMPRRFLWAWILVVMVWWWIAARGAAAAAGTPSVPLELVAVGGRFAGVLVEAAWYAAAWRGLGRRLPFGWFVSWLVTLTLLDLFGDSLRALATRQPGLAPWFAAVAGIGLLPAATQWSAGARVVFSPLGLLTVARIALAALLQARATGGSRATALALTVGTWLGGRIALWWTADLLRGMSPMP